MHTRCKEQPEVLRLAQQLAVNLKVIAVVFNISCVVYNCFGITFIASNVTSITEVRSASTCLFAGTWRPLVSVITTLYYVAIIIHPGVWYHALFLDCECI